MSKKDEFGQLEEDFFSRLPQKKRHLASLVILIVLPVIMYHATVLGGMKFMGHDSIQWRAGAESIIEYRQQTGIEPLWATNMFSGMPAYVVSVEKAVYHLDDLLFSLTESIFPAMDYWVLLIGMYVMLLMLKVRPLTAVLGSLGFAFTTYLPIIIGAGHNIKIQTIAFIPWMFVGYMMLTRWQKRRWISLSVFAIALTLQFRAGHPQVSYYFFYLLLFWWIADTYYAYQNNRIKTWSISTGLLGAGGLLGFWGNIQQYWRMLEFSPYSTRGGSALDAGGGGGLDLEYAFSWSQGPGELLTLIIPDLYGGASAAGAYWGPKSVTSGPHYMGAVVFILFLVGLFLYKKRYKYVFLGTGTLTLLFSLGYHFELLNEFMFHYVPLFDKFRTPEMWLIVTVFCFGIIAVFGLDELFEYVKKFKQKGKSPSPKKFYAPLGIALGIALIFTLWNDSLLSFEKPGEVNRISQQIARQNNVEPSNPKVQRRAQQVVDQRLKPERVEKAQSDSTRFFILILLTSALLFLFYQGKISKGYFVIALIIISSYDLMSVGSRYITEDQMAPESLTLEQAIEQRGQPRDRFMEENINDQTNTYPYRVFPLHRNPFNNAVPSYFYPSIGGYIGAKLSHYQDLIDELLYTGPNGVNTEILNMLNVKYISARQQFRLPGYRQVYNQEDGFVYQNSEVASKAFFVDSVVTVHDPRSAVNKLKPSSSLDFKAKQHGVVETGRELQAGKSPTTTARVTEYGPRNITIETENEQDGFLVLSEMYYPIGWAATIDGEEIQIYKTNYVLRGMQVPAGNHTIHLDFEPAAYIWGSRLSWVGNLLQWLIGLIGLTQLYRRGALGFNLPSAKSREDENS